MRATDAVWIDDVQVYPRVATRSAVVKGRIGRAPDRTARGTVELVATPLSRPEDSRRASAAPPPCSAARCTSPTTRRGELNW